MAFGGLAAARQPAKSRLHLASGSDSSEGKKSDDSSDEDQFAHLAKGLGATAAVGATAAALRDPGNSQVVSDDKEREE